MFRRFCDQSSLFIVTKTPKPLGAESRFNITLGDGKPMLVGAGRVVESHTSTENSFGRPGMRIRFNELDDQSREILERLNQARSVTSPTPVPLPKHMRRPPTVQPIPPRSPELGGKPVIKIPDIPGPGANKAGANKAGANKPGANKPGANKPGANKPEANKADASKPEANKPVVAGPDLASEAAANEAAAVAAASGPPEEQREQGSSFVLPANPFGALTDASLEAFVECTLYEETGNVFIGDIDGNDGNAPPVANQEKDVPAWWPRAESPVGPATAAPMTPRSDPTPPTPGATPLWTAAATSAPTLQPQAQGLMLPAGLARRSPMSRILIAVAIALPLGLLIGFVIWGGDDDDPAPAKQAIPTKSTPDNDKVAKLPPVSADAGVASTPRDAAGSAAAAAIDAAAAPAVPDPPLPDSPDLIDPGPSDCAIQVKVNKDEATVYADNKRVGMAPFSGVVPCSTTSITIRRARYEKITSAVALVSGETADLDLTLVRPTFKIQVSSSPSGATVTIGGRRVGTTPLTTSIRGFDKTTVKISKKGYKSYSKRIYPRSKSIGMRATLQRLRRSK